MIGHWEPIFAALVTLGVLAYFGIQAFRLFTDPLAPPRPTPIP
jgi:hypothetical protein